MWGDSITPPVAANLQFLMQERTVFDGSGIAETSTQVAARMIADTAKHNWVTVIWCGHNNISQPAQVLADIASMVDALTAGNRRFVVVSLDNEATPAGIKGGSEYPVVMGIDSQLAAAYPDNYLDARSALIRHYDPSNPQDVIDVQNDVVPSSLRYDEIHFRQEGSSFAAGLVRDFILAKGW